MAMLALFKFTIISMFVFRLCWGLQYRRCNERETEALLIFKAGMNDPYGQLSSWEKGADCCDWYGISCHNTTHNVVGIRIFVYGMKGIISKSLCSLTSLTSIELGDATLTGTISSCLGKLSSLAVLDLSSNQQNGSIPSFLSSFLSLSSLDLSNNQLTGSIPSSLSSLSSLNSLDLSNNQLTGSIPSSLSTLSSLSSLDLSNNQLTGSIPSSLSRLSSLKYIYLDNNRLSGSIPFSLGNISSLISCYLLNNSLSGQIPESLGNLSSLHNLDLSYNHLNGTLPSSFSRLSSLADLRADGNTFDQSIASSGLPSSLEFLSLTLNGHQIISEAFFHNLSKLERLYLSSCVLKITPTWVPSFQLSRLHMTSCKIDDQIPSWISTQFSLEELKLADNNLFGEIPSWLQDMNLHYINLSTNHLQGRLLLNTSAWKEMVFLDVSRNALCGQIPSIWPLPVTVLLLNDNLLTGNIPPRLWGSPSLVMLNLANNHLNGIIPPSLANFFRLEVLNLGDNNLKGVMPSEIGKLSHLQSLIIKNNVVSGSFPPSISNCTKLLFLDIGQNLFRGQIPKSIGNLSELQVLAMRQNSFEGSIPAELGKLKQLQIVDLSSNCLSGFIPHSIFSLQAMLIEPQQGYIRGHLDLYLYNYLKYIYHDELAMNSKGIYQHYPYIFSIMTSIDLSNNQLIGDVPLDLGKLKGLIFLNLSMNNFNGTIPNSIVQMSWLESLDLSTNRFCGQIPRELGSLSYLGFLNFSNNNLSGSIPQGGHMTTFANSSYEGNPNLWGCPLPKNCSWPEFTLAPPPISMFTNEEEEREESVWYEIGLGLSYGVGFGAVVAFIILKKKWGHKYFEGVDVVLKFLFPWLRNLTL